MAKPAVTTAAKTHKKVPKISRTRKGEMRFFVIEVPGVMLYLLPTLGLTIHPFSVPEDGK